MPRNELAIAASADKPLRSRHGPCFHSLQLCTGGVIMFKALFMMIVVSNDYAARLVQRFSRRTA